MADNKATALKDATTPNIKVELYCEGELNGNDPSMIDVTDRLDWSNAVDSNGRFNFGGVVGYRVSDAYDDSTTGPGPICIHLLYDRNDLEDIEKKIKRLLQAAIVNTKQYEAMEDMVRNIFAEQRSQHISRINMFSSYPLNFDTDRHFID